MPNFKIIQDLPDQARVKIFGSNNVALNTDSSGNLAITSLGLAITTGSGQLGVCIGTGGITVTTGSGSLSVCVGTGATTVTTGAGQLSVCIGTGGVTVTTGSGSLSVCVGTGATTITTGSGQLAVCIGTGQTSISVDNHAISDVSENINNVSNTTFSGATPEIVQTYPLWTFAVKNSAAAAANQAVVKLQVSPNQIDWIDESSPVTLNQNDITALVTSVHLKYARVTYQAVNAASAVTLNIFFQAQS